MKPAPAISVRATSGLGGKAAMIFCASSRGLQPAAFARRSAALVAKSPCCGSRARSIVSDPAAGGSGSTLPTSEVTALARSCSISCFTESRRYADGWSGKSYPKGSEQFDWIDVEGPAHATGTLQGLHHRQPSAEEAMERGAIGAFQQQLRVIAPGALRHRGGSGAEEAHGAHGLAMIRAAEPAAAQIFGGLARLRQERQRGLRGLRRITHRGQPAEGWPGG